MVSATGAIAGVILAAWLAGPARAEAPPLFEQHFSPAENLERIDVDLLDGAGETIDFAAYVLTDVAVIEALDRAAQRGVKVRVFRDSDEYGRGAVGAALVALERDGAVIRFKEPSRPLMHLKAYCVDGVTFRFGAANFSASGLKHQANDLDIRRGPDACVGFRAAFEKMWTD